MGFKIRILGQVSVLVLTGELDRHLGLRRLREAIAVFKRASGARLVLNFTKVNYICSEAVGEICVLADELQKAGGSAVCCGVQGMPRTVFDILGVNRILSIYSTEAEALKVFQTGQNTAGEQDA